MSSIKYRADIDGLRAIAVLSVFLFHLNEEYLQGGFLGVDVFFVISGFLITFILLKEISSTGKVDIKEFYRKRIKRIIPSFYLVLSVSIVASLIFLMPQDLINFGKTIKAAIFLQANVYFGSLQSYFSTDSDEFPLLHIWSLSIEEQFYFVWPLVLTLLYKWVKPSYKVALLWGLVLVLLGIGQFYSSNPATAEWSYFFSMTRSAEILIGCVAAYQVFRGILIPRNEKGQTALGLIGLVSIFSSMFVISKTSIFPGNWALVPCGGAYLYLISGALRTTPTHKMLSLPVVKWIGLHSYAIYLWHWVILAFYRYFSGTSNLAVNESIAIFVLTLLLSAASRKFVEVPMNSSQRSFRFIFTSYFAIPTLIFFGCSQVLRKTEGLPSRIPEIAAFEKESTLIKDKYCFNAKGRICNFGNEHGKRVLIFGDSYAGHFAPVFLNAIETLGYSYQTISSSHCAPILADDKNVLMVNKLKVDECLMTLNSVRKYLLDNKVEIVIIAGKWSNIKNAANANQKLLETFSFIKSRSEHLLVLGSIPYFQNKAINHMRRKKYAPIYTLLNIELTREDLKVVEDSSDKNRKAGNEFIHNLVISQKDIQYLDMEKLMNSKEIFLPVYQGEMLYSDSSHLNDYGSKLVASMLQSDLEKILTNIDKVSP